VVTTANDRYGTAEGVAADLKWIYLAWEKIRDTPFNMVDNTSDKDVAAWDRFEARWTAVEHSEAALRLIGFEGCVFSPRRCRKEQPILCQACQS
jgi:hypothetical protein